MHRSGTSCLAGSLEERGLVLGDVVNAAPHNLKGNKENIDLRSINDDVLAQSGGAWDKPPEALIWNDSLRRRRDAHMMAYATFQIWGFKDPRTLLTLPFWREAGQNFRFVGTFRHPRAVVRSLMVRKGLEPESSPLDLWKHYNLNLLEAHDLLQFPLVNFDLDQESYNQVVSEVAVSLGLPALSAPPLFYEASMRTGPSGYVDDGPIDDESLAIYTALQSRATEATLASSASGLQGKT